MALFLFLFVAKPVFAQQVTFGVTGGIRATGFFSGDLSDESKRYIVGPSADLRLPLRFSVEIDALYQRSGYSANSRDPVEVSQTRERDNIWEFPILAKYHLPGSRRIHPFAGVGVAPRIVTGRQTQSGYAINPFTGGAVNYYAQTSTTTYDPTVGLVFTGGFETNHSRMRFTPEVRYTRWNDRFLNVTARNVGFLGFRSYVANDSQLDVMIAIGWRMGHQ